MAYEVSPSYQSVVEKELVVREMGEAEYESLPTNSLASHMLAGGAAGILEHTVMYPVDCVKVRGRRAAVRRCVCVCVDVDVCTCARVLCVYACVYASVYVCARM